MSLSPRELDLLQRYLDGRTTEKETEQCDSRLQSDDAFRGAYAELRNLREAIRSTPPLEPDPAFWSRLTVRLEENKEEEKNLLPFSRRAMPAIGLGFAAVVVLGASFLFQNRWSFLRFWETQTEAVRDAYEQNFAAGSFIPLFSGLDADRTLQFALHGSLSLDPERGTTLNVDERSSEGYRIEVQRELPRKQKKVTVSDFLAEVRPTTDQKAVIDSLLAGARSELERAILVGENEAVAINTDLSKLNKAIASGIVGVLEPAQRLRLNRLLTEKDVAYREYVRAEDPESARKLIRSMQRPSSDGQFVVFSPDTILVRALTVDFEQVRRHMSENQAWFRKAQAMRARTIDRLINQPNEYRASVPTGDMAPRISLRARKDRLTIQIHADTMLPGVFFYGSGEGAAVVWDGDTSGGVRVEVGLPPHGGVAVAPSPPPVRAVRPDTARKRRPFKLDID